MTARPCNCSFLGWLMTPLLLAGGNLRPCHPLHIATPITLLCLRDCVLLEIKSFQYDLSLRRTYSIYFKIFLFITSIFVDNLCYYLKSIYVGLPDSKSKKKKKKRDFCNDSREYGQIHNYYYYYYILLYYYYYYLIITLSLSHSFTLSHSHSLAL